MTTSNETGYKTFQATAAAIAPYVRVKVDSNGLISVAGAAEIAIGVTLENIAASGYGSVKLFSATGTWLMTAGAAIARGAELYPLAAGKVDDTGTTKIGMVALEAATADGDVIECTRYILGS
jgi:hypothetical protein